MDERQVDSDLVEICRWIVAGLDRNPNLLSERHKKYFNSIEEALNHLHMRSTTVSYDGIQDIIGSKEDAENANKYWGGLNEDGSYGLGISVEEGERGYSITLNEEEVRDIVTGKSTKVLVEYE